ncbi:ribonuclease domain-containing protein [Bacillus thuringiensis]|uniref:ribonuclease domain-containing protein n=1 Tax=Bacillus thuringiensis TaxID=1428 RepID=UPI002FBDF879
MRHNQTSSNSFICILSYIYRNNESLLPSTSNRTWHEANINYISGYRGNDRISYSNDGLVYKTSDHYKMFTEVK